MSASDSDYPGAEYGYGPKRRGCGAALFQAFVFILVILGLGVVALFFGPPVVADYLKFSLGKLREQVLTETIQETFRQHTVKIASTNGNVLELATKVSDETFDRTTQLMLGGVKVPFFDNTVTQKARATYRYHIKLDGRWELRREGAGEETLIVIAPRIEPSLPAAFDSKAMESELKGYWIARYHQELSLEELRKGLTGKLEERALSQENIDSVREASRQSVAMFIKNWLAEDRTQGITQIKVLFPDEEQKDTEALPVTLELNSGRLIPGT
jgi:hypothetical protein